MNQRVSYCAILLKLDQEDSGNSFVHLPATVKSSVGMLHPSVILIILNFNGGDLVLRCVESALKMEYRSLRTIVVDNGSADGSGDVIRERFPEVLVLHSPDNVGVSGGRNIGIRHAFKEKFDYLLFSDHDVIIAPDLLARLIEVTEYHPKIGIAGPVLYSYDHPGRVCSAGMRINFREVIVQVNRRKKDEDFAKPFILFDAVGGGHMLVKRNVLKAIGPFDPAFFWGIEDVDFCLRARLAGFKTVVVPSARVLHKGGTTLAGLYSPSRTYFGSRSRVYFLRKHGRRRDWMKYLAFFSVGLFAAFCRELCLGRLESVGAKITGFRDEIMRKNIPSETASKGPPIGPPADEGEMTRSYWRDPTGRHE